MNAAALAAAAVVVALASVTHASISGNPDSWELPPAAPNYVYNTQALLGEGATATLVTIRDPLSSDLAYNTSLFAFSVSGGLVPLNFVQLDGHCMSTVVADLLFCDFALSAGGNPKVYQLAVNAGAGGANRLVVVDQVTVSGDASLGFSVTPVYVPATDAVVAVQVAAPVTNNYNVYAVQRNNTSSGQALAANLVGTISVGDSITSLFVNAAATELTVATRQTGLITYSYPGLQQLRTTPAPNNGFASLFLQGINDATPTDLGFFITEPDSRLPTTLLYQLVDLTTGKFVGTPLSDTSSSYFSSGIYVASSGSPFAGGFGPCVYVQGYANAQSKTQYGLISQLRVPTSATGTFAIEAQLPLSTIVANTMVANAGYLFTIVDEVMYRYIASC